MNDNEFFNATTQLTTIHQWARARYAAPWAVLGAVMLRVAATTGPHVQLPPIVGGHASLNLGAIFVGSSGGGKGISEKVARLAWPAGVIERPLGSGEGIAALFQRPKKEGAEHVTRALFSVPEIDTLTGMAARQGSILLAQLKSALMGELIGQSNASEATTRVVQAHTYRCCLSIGAQPGHAAVILNDTSGGTPQRMLWFPTTDPTMPDEPTPDPEPLDHRIPGLLTRVHDDPEIITAIIYGPEIIAQTIRAAQVAKGRGEVSELDGHAVLTRCKAAAVLAIMDHRTVVSELDWQLSEVIMATSDRTRAQMIEHAQKAARAKIRERAVSRAAGEDFYENSRALTVRNSLLRMLERDGEQSGSDLRRRLGTKEKRLLFDQVMPLLVGDGLVTELGGEQRGVRYRIGGHGDQGGHPQYSQVNTGDQVGHGDQSASVTELDSRRSYDSETPKLTGREWLAQHLAALRAAGHTTAESFAVLDAGEAAGYARQTIRVAASDSLEITVVGRRGKIAIWDITGTATTKHQSAGDWTANYIGQLARDGHTVMDKETFKAAGAAVDYSWTSLRHAATESGLIESVPGTGSETIWRIIQPADAEDVS